MEPGGTPTLPLQVTWTAQRAGDAVDLRYGEEVVISYLPLSHVAAQLNDLYITMRFAATTYFAQPDALKVSARAASRHRSPPPPPPLLRSFDVIFLGPQ